MENSNEQLAAVNELAEALSTMPPKELITSERFAQRYDLLLDLEKYIASIKEEVNSQIKEVVKENYYSTGESSICSGENRYTYVPETIRESFNSKGLKEDDPDLYKKYVKISPVKESFRVTKIKKKSEDSKVSVSSENK